MDLHIFAQDSILYLEERLSDCKKINQVAIKRADRTRAVESKKLTKELLTKLSVGYLVPKDASRRSER